MTNNNFNSSGITEEDVEIARSLKLGLIGGILTTIGDPIAIYAAGLAIEESIQESMEQNTRNEQQEERLRRIERNIELIQQQLSENRNPHR